MFRIFITFIIGFTLLFLGGIVLANSPLSRNLPFPVIARSTTIVADEAISWIQNNLNRIARNDKKQPKSSPPLVRTDNETTVLAAQALDPHFIFTVNVESFFRENAKFNKNVDIKGTLTAPNLFQSIVAGDGISTSGTAQKPTVTNTGVLSLQGETGAINLTGTGVKIEGTTITNTGVLSMQGKSGDVTLTNGSGIGINGTTISNTGVTSLQSQTGALNLTAGTGITISGLTITNSSPDTSQNTFSTINVGNTTFSAGSNTDTLTFASGSGIIITPDTTGKSLTITADAGSISQWTTNGTNIYYNTGAVGIGTSSPLGTLDIRGNSATTPAASISTNSNLAAMVVDNSGSGDLFTASKSGAIKFTIANNGNVTINGSGVTGCIIGNGTSATSCTASDKRLKDNITPLSDIKGLDAVRLLNPVSYKWNSFMQGNGATGADQFGFIAQDVANVFPNLVEQDKNTGFYKLDYQGFFAPLVKSIQELDVQVSSSGDLISGLALRVDALEQQATASAELNTKKSAFADLVSLTSSLNSTGSSTLISTLIQNPDFVKGIFNLDVEMPGIEPGRLGLTTQSSEPATPAPVSLSQLLANLVNNDASRSIQLSSLEAQIASLSGSLMPISPIPSLATSGAQLTFDALDVHDATVSGTLSILGRTLLSDVGITGNLNAGLLTINGLDNSCHSPEQGNPEDCSTFASINTLSGPLRLQSDGLNGLDILDGKVTIAENGNITTKGSITAKSVTTDKINITASYDASSSGSLAPRSLGEVGSTSAGSIIIPAGQISIDVSTDTLTPKSLIFATPDQAVTIGAKAKDYNTFTIKLQQIQTTNIKVNWWLIN